MYVQYVRDECVVNESLFFFLPTPKTFFYRLFKGVDECVEGIRVVGGGLLQNLDFENSFWK